MKHFNKLKLLTKKIKLLTKKKKVLNISLKLTILLIIFFNTIHLLSKSFFTKYAKIKLRQL